MSAHRASAGWVPRAFDALWEGDTDRDRLVANLDVADADELVRVLDGSLEAVRRHAFTFDDWVRYKHGLLETEAEWGETMFVWAPQDLQRPYVDVDRDALRAIRAQDEKLWRRAIFVLWMALQDPDPPALELQTSSIWDLIDPIRSSEGSAE